MLQLTQKQLELCFPFCFAIDKDGLILFLGKSIKKIIGESALNRNVLDEFNVIFPVISDPKYFENYTDTAITLEHKKLNLKLIGQIFKDETKDRYIFAVSLQFNEIDSFSKFGINFADFAPQDQVFDFLIAFHSYRKADQDAAKLNKELKKQKNIAIAASEMKTKFLANMSHELRTPLNGIIGMASVLKEIVADEAAQEFIQTISNSGDHLLSLINDILDLSKIEAGQTKISPQPTNIREHLNTFKSTLQVLAEHKNNQISFEIDDNLPKIIFYDPIRVVQILTNLIGNAIKFTRNGQVKLILSSLSQNEDTVTIKFEVTDTGPGIPSDMLDKIFSPFMQIEQVEKNISGTGLGLSICQNLVESMGGKISVSSEMNKGSNFHFDLNFPIYHE